MYLASIVIPTFNAEQFLRRAIESALNQTMLASSYEILVINDGSTDSTQDLLDTYSSRIRVVNQDNAGFAKASDRGFRESTGKYVVKLDSDDFFAPELLAKTVAKLEDNPILNYVFADYYEQCGEVTKLVSLAGEVFHSTSVGFVYRKDSLVEAGYWNTSLLFPEYDLLLRTLSKWKGEHIATPLHTYVRRGGSVTLATEQWDMTARSQLIAIHPEHSALISKIRKF